jgi:predicted GNAT family acetyltransferase
VLGDGDRPHWFADEAAALGVALGAPIPQRIHVLRQPPRHPNAAGVARPANAEDAPLLYAWLSAFQREAIPQAPPATWDEADKAARSGRFLLWTVDSRPVAMAAISRNLRQTGSIGAVYTSPEHRSRGYAGAVTATLAGRILAEGKAACLYTDLRNPVSNRCYARIGFIPYCDTTHYPPAALAA